MKKLFIAIAISIILTSCTTIKPGDKMIAGHLYKAPQDGYYLSDEDILKIKQVIQYYYMGRAECEQSKP